MGAGASGVKIICLDIEFYLKEKQDTRAKIQETRGKSIETRLRGDITFLCSTYSHVNILQSAFGVRHLLLEARNESQEARGVKLVVILTKGRNSGILRS